MGEDPVGLLGHRSNDLGSGGFRGFPAFFPVGCVGEQLLVLSPHGHLLLFCLTQKIPLPFLPEVPHHCLLFTH